MWIPRYQGLRKVVDDLHAENLGINMKGIPKCQMGKTSGLSWKNKCTHLHAGNPVRSGNVSLPRGLHATKPHGHRNVMARCARHTTVAPE